MKLSSNITWKRIECADQCGPKYNIPIKTLVNITLSQKSFGHRAEFFPCVVPVLLCETRVDYFSTLPLILNSFCLNKNRSMPKLQFLTASESPETLAGENVCKVVSNNSDF